MTTPIATAAPSIVGLLLVGVQMSVVPGTYSNAVTSRAYQWKKNGTPISGATSTTYTPVSGDAQASITCGETATNTDGPAAENVSAAMVCAPAPLGSTSANYTTALAAVTDGQYFSHTALDGVRVRVYLRTLISGTSRGVQVGVTPLSGSINTQAAAFRAIATYYAIAPLVDFDVIEMYYGEAGSIRSLRPGDGAAPLDLLQAFAYTKTGYTAQNGITVANARVADSQGGTLGLELTVASAAVAASDLQIFVVCPPGYWTLALDLKAASAQNIQISYNGLANLATKALTTSWQTFTQEFNLTAETVIVVMLMQGSYPSAAAQAYDYFVSNMRITPGSGAGANSSTAPHFGAASQAAATFDSTNPSQLYSAALSTPGNTLQAKISSMPTLTGWSYVFQGSGDLSAAGGSMAVSLGLKATPIGKYLQQLNASGNLAPYMRSKDGTNLPGLSLGATGQVVHGVSSAASGLRTYITPGVPIDAVTTLQTYSGADAAVTDLALIVFQNLMGLNSRTASNGWLGRGGGFTLWGQSQTDAEMAASIAYMSARATAKGITLQPTRTIVTLNGDSISRGYADSPNVGFIIRGCQQNESGVDRSPRIQAANKAVVGYKFSQMVTGQLAITIAAVQAYVAAGIIPIVTILIGANDDTTLITQAACDSYYSNGSGFTYTSGTLGGSGGLKEYYAILRANGAKVIALTCLPNGRTAAFDSTSLTTTTTATATASGIAAGTVFAGPRLYLNALIAGRAGVDFDALADIANESHFAGTYATMNGGVPGTVMGDTLHPNLQGNLYLQPIVAAPITSLSSGSTYNLNVVEAVAASDSNSGALSTSGAITDAVVVSETAFASLTTTAARAEVLAAADTVSGAASTSAAVTEAGAAVDITSGSAVTSGSVTEAAVATDIPTALSFNGLIVQEGVTVDDIVSSLAAFNIAVVEQSLAIDSVTGNVSGIITGDVSELCNAVDTLQATGGTPATRPTLSEIIPSILNGLVDGRVWQNATPDDLPRSSGHVILPFILWHRVSGQDAEYVDQTASDKRHARIQVSSNHPSAIGADRLLEHVMQALLASSYTVGVYGSPVGDYDGPRKLHAPFQQFSIWFKNPS